MALIAQSVAGVRVMVGKGRAILPYIFALAYFASAIIALELTQGKDGIAAVWPPSGFFIAGLLFLDNRRRDHLTAAVAVASLAANLWTGVSLWASISYTVANLIEGYLVFFLMGAHRRRPRLSEPVNLLRFGGSAIVGGCASAMMAGVLSSNFSSEFLGSWASTVTLGMMIVTPVILFVAENPEDRANLPTFRAFWIFLLVAFSSLIAFGQAEIPLIFVPVVAISIATYALGLGGTAIAALIVAALGSILTVLNTGPLPLFFDHTKSQVLFFQIYLVALLVSGLPLAALLEQRRRNLAEIGEANRMLESAEQAASVGHWRYRIRDGMTFWSTEARRLLDLPETQDAKLTVALSAFHTEDRGRIRAIITQAVQNGIPFVFEARIPSRDARTVHVECRGKVEFDSEQKVSTVFGTILDVSERAQAMRAATVLRERAEREAIEVRRLAETDALTGLANRRKILARLQEAIGAKDPGNRAISIAMIDIDHFKSINDRFGHEAGDRVLVSFAKLLRDTIPEASDFGRIGGEEFLAVLPSVGLTDAVAQVEACRAAAAQYQWQETGLEPVTFSAGVAQLGKGQELEDLLRNADLALYTAKNSGRDRVIPAS